MWWLHMIVVLGFLVYLPYSKHLHLLASPFNVFFSGAVTRPLGDLTIPGRKGGRGVRRVEMGGTHLEAAPQRLFLRRVRPLRPGLSGHDLRLPAGAAADRPEDQDAT